MSMDKSSKKDLIETIGKQKEQLTRYECRLRDVVTAYKGLLKEKEALDASLKALNGSNVVSDTSSNERLTSSEDKATSSSVSSTEDIVGLAEKDEMKHKDMETVEQLRVQLSTLMNSLATLSAEKSRMEASFQADKKQLRAEKEAREKTVKDLHDRLQNISKQRQIDVETVKSKLIVERHLREKEQNDHGVMIRELQKLLSDERRAKEKLESQVDDLRSKLSSLDSQSGQHEQYERKLQELRIELESSRRKLKRAETKASETPPLLLELQEEMVKMKTQHQKAIQEEQKRAADAENAARGLAEKHEERVANLEARLAELSTSVGSYDRLRQQDQLSIQRLKEHIAQVELEQSIMPSRITSKVSPTDSERDLKGKSEADLNLDVQSLVSKILYLRGQLIIANQRSEKPMDIKAILNPDGIGLETSDGDVHSNCREEYQLLEQKFEFYKLQNTPHKSNNSRKRSEDKGSALEGQVQALKERIQILNSQLDDAEKDCKQKVEHFSQIIKIERTKNKEEIVALDADFRGQILFLEQQLQKQRERSLTLLEEKEQEIQTLKSTFQMFLPGHASSESPKLGSEHPGSGTGDDVMTSLSQFGGVVRGMGPMGGGESPHMLHYAHELSRRDVEISNLRKAKYGLECKLRELLREDSTEREKFKDRVHFLQEEVSRLERCKSREGANLEYLKNVVLSFLTSGDPNSRHHMLNAIAAVLKFSNAELEKVSSYSKMPVA